MAEYNIKKVFRSVGKELLREYFNQKAPGAEIDWESVGTRNVETLFRAYKALPDDIQQTMQGELNELFDIASDRSNGTTLHTIIKQAGLTPPDDFSEWTLPDQTMWLMLHGSEEDKRRLSRFSDIDPIAERFWLPCKLDNGGAGKLDYEDGRKRRLETSVSKFIYDLEGRGKLCMLEYFDREDRDEECFFLYLNNHQKMTPQWHGQVCEWLRDPTSYEIVFVYNYARNELRIRAKGLLKEHRVTLCQIWADVMRDARLDDACLKKATYDIDAFKYRENSGLPDELMEDVSELDVSFIDVDLDGTGKERMTFKLSEGNVYDSLDRRINPEASPRGIMVVHQIKFHLQLTPKHKYNRAVTVAFSRSQTNLFSKNEAIRDLLQTIFTKWGVIAEDEVVEERIAKAV